MISNEMKGVACVITSGFLYSVLGYFGMSLLKEGMALNTMLFWRFFVASLVLLFPMLSLEGFNSVKKYSLKVLLINSALFGGSSVFFFMASRLIGTGLAMVIFFIYPAILACLNWFFYNIPLTKKDFLAFMGIIIGIIFLGDVPLVDFTIEWSGILLACLSGACYAIYLIYNKHSLAELPPLSSSLSVSIGASLIFLAISVSVEQFSYPNSPKEVLNLFGLAFFATAAPMLLMLIGLQYISILKASLLSVLEPVFTVIMGYLLLGEMITIYQIIGMFIIIVSILLLQVKK